MPLHKSRFHTPFLYSSSLSLVGERGKEYKYNTIMQFTIHAEDASAGHALWTALEMMVKQVETLGGNAAVQVTVSTTCSGYSKHKTTLKGTAVKIKS